MPLPLETITANTIITGQTVANFFKPASQKPTPSQPKKVSWRIVNNSCIVGHYLVGQKGETQKEEQKNEIKIAAFDLVCTPSVIQHLTVWMYWIPAWLISPQIGQ